MTVNKNNKVFIFFNDLFSDETPRTVMDCYQQYKKYLGKEIKRLSFDQVMTSAKKSRQIMSGKHNGEQYLGRYQWFLLNGKLKPEYLNNIKINKLGNN